MNKLLWSILLIFTITVIISNCYGNTEDKERIFDDLSNLLGNLFLEQINSSSTDIDKIEPFDSYSVQEMIETTVKGPGNDTISYIYLVITLYIDMEATKFQVCFKEIPMGYKLQGFYFLDDNNMDGKENY